MDDPEQWRWIWLVAAVGFGLGEMATPGSFFLAPFAVGAAVAAVLAFADVSVVLEWTAFVVVSVACLLALRPLARRLDRAGVTEGIGSRRLIGRRGVVLDAIPAGDLGTVRVDREEWRAMTADRAGLQAGSPVVITEVEGTKVVVIAAEETPS
ncbi:MAG TPA: NfeD family protein [Acidimicrobiales bacterium]|nr:NfeD family protein [Acidimicrobiales bacterium]